MVVNAVLGTVLWEAYSQTTGVLEPYLGSAPILTAALSGAVAGGAQALVAAPAENIRLVLEGGTGHGWSYAWKEVFRGTVPPSSSSKQQNIQEIRQVREWMKEVGYMAGRGWDGWGWGCAKDICGENRCYVFSQRFSTLHHCTAKVLRHFLPYSRSHVTWHPKLESPPRLLRKFSRQKGASSGSSNESFTASPLSLVALWQDFRMNL